jgi:hypothetical protein
MEEFEDEWLWSFTWKDGRSYKGEYKDDKKHHFGIYNGVEGKRYEGYWEGGIQKNLGKYYKKDGSIKIGYWDENQNMTHITDEDEMARKLTEVDKMKELTYGLVSKVVEELRKLFKTNIPDLDFESLIN